MLSPRAPLFSVSLAFATGCLLGLDGILSLPGALFVFFAANLAWFLLVRFPRASLTAFYFLVAAAGMAHTLLIAAAIPANDLRHLPDDKLLETTQWRGVIIEEPVLQMSGLASRRALDRTSFVLSIESWRPTHGRLFGANIDAPWQAAQGNVACTLIGPARDLRCGDRLEFAAALQPIAPPLNPGDLSLPAYDAHQQIYYSTAIRGWDWQPGPRGHGDWLQDFSFQARDWAYARLQIGLEDDPRTADFLAGMLIGYRQEIPTDIEQDFRRTGTIHVFAVSGQNIAEMAAVVLILLQLCGVVRWRWAWTLTPLLLIYCLLTGSPSSAIRATVMALTVLLAWRLGRPLNALGCWSLAALAMMIWDPTVLLDVGAQLSFGVVLALILIAPPLLRLMFRPFEPDSFVPRSLLSPWQLREEWFWWGTVALVASGFAAMLVSEPITAIAFHQVTPISVLANLIVVPLAGLITTVGTLAVATSVASTTLAALINNSNWLLARALILIVGCLAHEPGASINVPDLSILGAAKPLFVVAPLRDSACLLVRTPSGAWLINTGRESPTPSSSWHLLQFYGLNRLDGLVLAQLSEADNGGALAIARDFQPARLATPFLPTRSPFEKKLPDILAQAGRPDEKWHRGESFALGPGVTVDVLGPATDGTSTRAADRSLVLLFHAGGQKLLWAGAIDADGQRELRQAYPGLHADVLVMRADEPLDPAWLGSLQVRDWLQIPPRDRESNPTDAIAPPAFCKVWPLNQTGAVAIQFTPAHDGTAPEILLRPWLALQSAFVDAL